MGFLIIALGAVAAYVFSNAMGRSGSRRHDSADPQASAAPRLNPRAVLLDAMNDNRSAIEHSTLCGCARCGALFKPEAIRDWYDSNQGLDDDVYDWEGLSVEYAETYEANTALCPHCNGSWVVCNANLPELSAQTLTDLHRLFFKDTGTSASSADASSPTTR